MISKNKPSVAFAALIFSLSAFAQTDKKENGVVLTCDYKCFKITSLKNPEGYVTGRSESLLGEGSKEIYELRDEDKTTVALTLGKCVDYPEHGPGAIATMGVSDKGAWLALLNESSAFTQDENGNVPHSFRLTLRSPEYRVSVSCLKK